MRLAKKNKNWLGRLWARAFLRKKRTLDQFARDYAARKVPRAPRIHSHFKAVIRDIDGNIKAESDWRHNLTTDTATGFTNRRDWQSKAMGGGFAEFATAAGTLTACTATIATNSGATFITAGQGLAGCVVVVGANASGAGTVAWGMIQSNTGTALTVDRWTNGGTGGTQTTPNATGQYIIIPGQAAARWLGVTATGTAPTSADTALASEATTNGFARAIATFAHSAAATTYTEVVVFTASGSLTPAVMAAFSGANTTSGGVMPFSSAIPSPPVMLSGDTLTLTHTITVN